MTAKIKTISRYTGVYNRESINNNEQIEQKYLTSYTEMDERGNVITDKTFNRDGSLENCICRTFNDKNLLIQEDFLDGEDTVPYESRINEYDDNDFLVKSIVCYAEDKVEEIYHRDEQGHLLKKEVIYEDGESNIETECVWTGDLVKRIVEYDEDGEENVIRDYQYNNEGKITQIDMEEKSVLDKHTETYEYDNGKITQTLYNLKGKPVSVTVSVFNEQGQLLGKTVETQTQFFKYIYSYDEQGNKKRESMLNRDDLLLNDQQIEYNEFQLETCTKSYSRNIVDNNDEMLPVEINSIEYTYWD